MRALSVGLIACLCLLSGCASPERRVLTLGKDIKAASYRRPRNFSPYSPDKTRVNAGSIPAGRLHAYDAETLQKLYDSAHTMTFYFPEAAEYFSLQEKLFAEIMARGNCTEKTAQREYNSRIKARDFAGAAELVRLFPGAGLDPLPEIAGSSLPPGTLWLGYSIANAGRQIRPAVVPLSVGKKILFVMSPGCGFVEAAMTDLSSEPELWAFVKSNGIFVSVDFAPVDLFSWAEKYSIDSGNVYIPYKNGNFPGVRLDNGTPQLYFMEDGKIKSSSDGWCVSGHAAQCLADFRRGLAAAGFL